MVAADIEEAAHHLVLPARDDDRFPGAELARDVTATVAHLVKAADDLPRAGEDGAALQVEDSGIDVPGGGDGRGAVERRVGGVALDDRLQRLRVPMRPHG
jgi:hypothetical protein